MPQARWRPASEAEAAGAGALFIEWCRATRGVALDGAPALAAWRRDEPGAFADAIADFAGLTGDGGPRDALLRGNPSRAALIVDGAVWSRGALLAAAAMPAWLDAALEHVDLVALAAFHLLDAGTAPDDCVPWDGDPGNPSPLGAWLVGASVLVQAASLRSG
jgi:hypothetical protein